MIKGLDPAERLARLRSLGQRQDLEAQYRRDDLEVAFADVSEGAAVGQVKIVEMLAAKGAGDHLAPMTWYRTAVPSFSIPFPRPRGRHGPQALSPRYAARPPATATLIMGQKAQARGKAR